MKQMTRSEKRGTATWTGMLQLIASNFSFLTLIPEPVDLDFIELDERIAHSWNRVGESLKMSLMEMEGPVLGSIAPAQSLAGIRRISAGCGRPNYLRFGEMVRSSTPDGIECLGHPGEGR